MRPICTLIVTAALICSGCARSNNTAAEEPSVNPALPLVGFVDIPKDDAATIAANSDFPIGGWAVWGQKAQSVNIVVDGAVMTTAPVNIPRPDVYKIHAQYAAPNSGWGAAIPAGRLSPGTHKVTVQVVSSLGQTDTLKTISLDVTR